MKPRKPNQIPTPSTWENGYDVGCDECESSGPTLFANPPWTLSQEERIEEFQIIKQLGITDDERFPLVDRFIDPQIHDDIPF